MENKLNVVCGVDVGGSHITAVLVNLHSKKVHSASLVRKAVDSGAAANTILDVWASVIKEAFGKAEIAEKKIGIAMPGPFDYERGVSYMKSNKKYESLYGLDVKKMLADRLQNKSANIRMINDAASFLNGEVVAGNYDCRHAVGITLGTGLGSAVYHEGRAGDAALWDSPFRDGIAEDYLSTRWFTKRYFELTYINVMDVKTLNDIYPTSLAAKVVFKEFSANLGAFIKEFVQCENADIICLGGNISKASPRFLPTLKRYLKYNGIDVPIKISKLGECANLIGAAGCWLRH